MNSPQELLEAGLVDLPIELPEEPTCGRVIPFRPSEAAPEGTKPPLELRWFLGMRDFKHHEFLVKGLLSIGSMFLVYGASNSGKSFLALDLALAVAAGRQWCGRPTRRGLAIYVAGEGAASVGARVMAYRAANPNAPDDLAFAVIPQPVDFLSAVSVQELISTIRAAEVKSGEKATVIILDTLARCTPGGDENSAKDMGVAIASADRIRSETGAALGFIHHAGKDVTKGARGSSALRAAVDTEILVEGQSGQRTATVTKQRDLDGGQRLGFELAPVLLGTDDEGSAPITSCVVHYVETVSPKTQTSRELRGKCQRRFVDAMRKRPEKDATRNWTLAELREIGRLAEMSKCTSRSVVDTLVASPWFAKTAGGYRFIDGRIEG